jgi:2-methylcitrate dehydratase PrpD
VANGVAGCWCELDEGYRGAPCHAGLYVLPALLAEAEQEGRTLREVLQALAIAYEVNSRIAEAWTFKAMTVHPHAAFAVFGAAAGAALARGVDAGRLAAALRIAGGLVPAGAYQAAVEGALVRNLWTGHCAITGMSSVDWACAGLDGYPDGPHPAFSGLLGATVEPQKLAASLGQRWAILHCYHKLHGCCHSTHAAVEAALQAHRQLGPGTIAQAAAIDVFTHRPSMSNPSPGNSLAARFSFEHVTCVALMYGHAGPTAFSASAIDDTAVSRLRQHVRLHPYTPLPDWPRDRPARVVLTLADGTSQSFECISAPGGPDQPLSAEAILGKTERLVGAACPRFATTARALLATDPEALDRPISEVLGDLLRSHDR